MHCSKQNCVTPKDFQSSAGDPVYFFQNKWDRSNTAAYKGKNARFLFWLQLKYSYKIAISGLE